MCEGKGDNKNGIFFLVIYYWSRMIMSYDDKRKYIISAEIILVVTDVNVFKRSHILH